MKPVWRIFFAALLLFPAACARYDDHVETLPPEVAEQMRAAEKLPPKTAAENEEMITVGTITIFNRTALPASDFFAPFINNIHFVTQKDVIYDELDLKEGDRIPRWKLYDAERYIRLLSPIKQAQIIENKNDGTGKSDLVIVTQDRLTAQVQGGANGSGGYSNFSLRAVETSLLGRLYIVSGEYERENFRDFVTLGAGKMRIAGSRWQTGISSKLGFSDSQFNYFAHKLVLAHPFTWDGQRHAFSVQADVEKGTKYDYLGGGIRKGRDPVTGNSFDLIYHRRTQGLSALYLYGIGKNDRIEFGPGVWHYMRSDYYVQPDDQYSISNPRELNVSAVAKSYYQGQAYSTNALVFAVNTRNGQFGPMKNFHRYLFTEDHFEGLRTAGKIIHANPALGLADHFTAPSLTVSYQKNFIDRRFRIETSASRTAIHWHHRYEYPTDDIWNADLRGFWFNHWGTFAVRQYVSQGYHLTADRRTEIGGAFTRGFYYGSVYPSAGSLSSLEYRSPGLKLPYFLIAGVLFFDYAGIGERFSSLEWYPVAGLGFRTMLHEFDNNVFRFDIGMNLREQDFNLLNALQFGLNHSF